MIETFTLKSQLDATRQELAQALYQHDASCRVIARLMRERDEARAALASMSSSTSAVAVAVQDQSMGVVESAAVVDGPGLNESVIAALNEKCKQLSGSRKGRKIPEGLLSKEQLSDFSPQRSFTPHKSDKGAVHCIAIKPSEGASSDSADVLLTGGADGSALLLDSVSGGVLGKLTGHSKKVTSVSFHPNAHIQGDAFVAFTASADKTVKVSNIFSSDI
jgi:pre-mRNA-processing factor 19